MTTGRINQVASVDNTARRRLRAPKSEDRSQVAGQAGVEASVFQGSRDSETGWDRNPTFHPMDRIREDGERPCARTDRDSARQKWNPDGTLKSLARGTQRRDPAIPPPGGKDGVRMEVVCMRTVRCASTEPASKSIPITTHTPSRERRLQHCQADHPPMQCHKASFG